MSDKPINNIKYYNYIGNIKRNGLYICNECSKEVRISNINTALVDYAVGTIFFNSKYYTD